MIILPYELFKFFLHLFPARGAHPQSCRSASRRIRDSGFRVAVSGEDRHSLFLLFPERGAHLQWCLRGRFSLTPSVSPSNRPLRHRRPSTPCPGPLTLAQRSALHYHIFIEKSTGNIARFLFPGKGVNWFLTAASRSLTTGSRQPETEEKEANHGSI